MPHTLRTCLRDPIPEIGMAARLLDQAVSAHLQGDLTLARQFLLESNMPAVRQWTDSLWGKSSQYAPNKRIMGKASSSQKTRVPDRMPNAHTRRALLARDGNHCRFCGIPLVRAEVRRRLVALYPELKLWGRKNPEQHAALQCMWVQYDHLVPHAHEGENSTENLLITCAPCNYGRMDFTLEESGLSDPFLRPPIKDAWDGLERLLKPPGSVYSDA